ncbi:NADH-quinone oxidoreductase subunit 5 family protein [Streptomyces sp. NBC_01803]|uniref:NADH-quinone oxidoreductase subunit 5 family protein n=1 Tax=Streptomyces sp. NBC_01803 TaxID=2975946 RepID=UPI002DDC0F97|nr:NADH-quinone oxidoreductase subunit L [Streptomyces sp. NBC_01803]WSA45738.1 NADH-quinone oxidoreductase subunit L [Streptomyces sp. NBC_01803]
MNTTTAAVLVPLLPFAAAALILLTGRRAPEFARPLAVLPTLLSAALAVFVALRQGGDEPIDAATRLTRTGNDALPIELALHLDGYAVLVAVLVTVVAGCVQLYSTGYMRGDARYPSYAALVSLFTAAMLLVVYTDDLIVLLTGWEVMGIASYFLVGHYWETSAARAASLKAFLVTKLGDVPFLIGILILAGDAGTFRISAIADRLSSPSSSFALDHPTLVALLLLAGVAGKSAQVPLHTWLPDAMAGPTPVSALIHAATMVAAGVYFVARLLPVFTASAAALTVLAVVSALTMLGSALAALAQDDVKRILAYSTIGQLGYMTGALAVADREAAVFHLLTHGAFKALLFLTAGVLIHTAGTGSLTAMSRLRALRRRAPDAFWAMTIGLLALAAVPPFSGFFSKEAVLGAAEHAALDSAHGVPAAAGWIVLVAGLATALVTAAYAARLWLVAFHDPAGVREEPVPVGEGASPAMTAVLWLLALPALALGLAYRELPDWFDGGSLAPSPATSALATGAALFGALIAWAGWRRAYEGDRPVDPGPVLLGRLHRHAAAGFHLDAVYAAAFVRPVRAAARLVRFLDAAVVDTYVRGAANGTGLLGTLTRRAQTGNIQTYLSALAAGALILTVAAVLVVTGK